MAERLGVHVIFGEGETFRNEEHRGSDCGVRGSGLVQGSKF